MAIQLSKNNEDSSLQPKKTAELPEDQTHSFVVRFWLERGETKAVDSLWRGVIEHVLSGRKKYLKKFDEVADFISAHLKG